jgi:hypothetical protein
MDREHWRRSSRSDLATEETQEAQVGRPEIPRLHIRYRARYHPRLRPGRVKNCAHDRRHVDLLLETLRSLDEALLGLERRAARPGGFERLGRRLVRGFERRAALASRLPFGLDDVYRVLATRYLSPICTIVTHRCSGCGHGLPSKTEESGRLLGGFLLCPHCGRILLIDATRRRDP